jgi:hypothetical protein
MSAIADRLPTSPGLTSPLDPPPDLPSAEAAREFYLYGAGATASAVWHYAHRNEGWVVSGAAQKRDRLAALIDLVAFELRRIQRLRPGWDGHHAVPVTQAAIYASASLLGKILDATSEPPQIFPLPDGSVQIEWYAGDEIDIEIDSGGAAHVLATSSSGQTLVEGSFDPQAPSQMISDLAKYVRELSAWVAEERQRA